MKKTLLITLVSTAIFSGANALTNAILKNDSDGKVEATFETTTGDHKKIVIKLKAGESSGNINTPCPTKIAIRKVTGTGAGNGESWTASCTDKITTINVVTDTGIITGLRTDIK